MKTAGIAELKAHLSRFLDEVKGGEELVITDRGLPIARIVPLGDKDRTAKRQHLVRAGLLQPARKRIPPAFFRAMTGPPDEGGAVLAALLEERREGR